MSKAAEPATPAVEPAPMLPPTATPKEPTGKTMEHVIPTRNQPALAGYYCAIFSLIPIAGLFLGPAAIAYGILGMERGNRLPRHIGYGHALFATIGGIIGSIISYGMVVAVGVVLALNFMGGIWPFPHEQREPPMEQVEPPIRGKAL